MVTTRIANEDTTRIANEEYLKLITSPSPPRIVQVDILAKVPASQELPKKSA